MIDAELKNRAGAWAWICPDFAAIERVHIGWGSGQLYQRNGDGWVLAAGGLQETT